MLNALLKPNFILAADSYKFTHWLQVVIQRGYTQSSIVPRASSRLERDEIVVACNRLIASYLSSVIITEDDVDEAEIEVNQQGYEFNREGWMHIVRNHGGRLPIQMLGVPDGTIVRSNTAIAIFQNTDPAVPWLPPYIETWAQCIAQSATTTASLLRQAKRQLTELAVQTGCPVEMVDYKVHNFGDRGGKAPEVARLTAIPHAMFFSGSDSGQCNRDIKFLYKTNKSYTSSVDAFEHTTTCMSSNPDSKDDFGAAVKAVELLERAVKRTREKAIGIPLLSCPIDTYDSHRFVSEFIGERLKDRIIASGGVFVARPDSGDPLVEPGTIVSILRDKVGYSLNDKGYFVLHDSFRVIQGDEINYNTLLPIARAATIGIGGSLENITFGMGGGMSHGEGRGFLSFSQKSTAYTDVENDPFNAKGTWKRLLKEPKTDLKKKSLSGYLDTFYTADGIRTLNAVQCEEHFDRFGSIPKSATLIMYSLDEGGECFDPEIENFDKVRERANVNLL